MPLTTLFIDLDGTLYDNGVGLWQAISDRIDDYLHQKLDMPPAEIPRLRRAYFDEYGTTLRGLLMHHDIDPADYLAFVHQVPLENYLKPDRKLRAMLLEMPQAKWVFTNSDRAHTRRVLETLDVADCFKGIFDVWAMQFKNKPDRSVYRLALKAAGETQPRNCLLVDDLPRNLAPARELGFHTVLVGTDEPHPAAECSIKRLIDLPKVLPELVE